MGRRQVSGRPLIQNQTYHFQENLIKKLTHVNYPDNCMWERLMHVTSSEEGPPCWGRRAVPLARPYVACCSIGPAWATWVHRCNNMGHNVQPTYIKHTELRLLLLMSPHIMREHTRSHSTDRSCSICSTSSQSTSFCNRIMGLSSELSSRDNPTEPTRIMNNDKAVIHRQDQTD